MKADYSEFILSVRLALEGVEDEPVELHARKHAFRVAEAWGQLPEYRRKRREIRRAERERREALKRRNG